METQILSRKVLVGTNHNCEQVDNYDGKRGYIFYDLNSHFRVFWPEEDKLALIEFLQKENNAVNEISSVK